MSDSRLKDSQVFCMAPWVHLHTWPSGEVFPCCMTPMQLPTANLKEMSLKESWNSPKMKELRQNMLNEKKSEYCQRCYEMEGAGFQTLRKNLNRDFAHHLPLVDTTLDDGAVEKVNLAYMDTRFSNICNFRCRSCGPQLSSSWFEDNIKLYGASDEPKVIRPYKDAQDLYSQIEEHLDSVEEIYFAGGEPLFMDEHYWILDHLVKKKRTSVRLRYNTNFSIMKFKKWNVFDFWKQFETVEVGASLDAFGKRGEYMRKGQKWDQVEKNREDMLKEVPHAHFFISATLSVMNAFQVPEFHRTWIEKGWVTPHAIVINPLLEPALFCIQIMTPTMKERFVELYEKHLEYLRPMEKSEHAVGFFESAIQFVNADNKSHLIPDFWERTKKLDEIRGENILQACPELKEL